MTLRERVEHFSRKLQCNCDLDNWQPEPETGHSWVCRIHIAAKSFNAVEDTIGRVEET